MAQQEPEDRQPPRAATSPQGQVRRVAIVDGDEQFRAELSHALDRTGYSVWAVNSAEACYRKMLSSPVDLAFVGTNLPGEDGLSLVTYLNQLGKCATVVLSADASDSERAIAISAGADRFLGRPLRMDDLQMEIQAVSLRRQLNASLRALRPETPADIGNPWRLNPETLTLQAPNGKRVDLTSREYSLLLTLMEQPQVTISKSAIVLATGSDDAEDFHRIDNTLLRLRKKVERMTEMRVPVHSIFGRGLTFTGTARIQ